MKKRVIQLIVFLFCIGVILPAVITSCAQSQEAELKLFLEENKATPKMGEGYRFAMEHPEVLKFIPCYCGCKRHGHKSNYHCFMKEPSNTPSKTPFDAHGLVCPMCVQIALEAKKELENGKSVAEIRENVDKVFSKYPHLHSTETPLPEGMSQHHHESEQPSPETVQ
jgi:hypothetical protein